MVSSWSPSSILLEVTSENLCGFDIFRLADLVTSREMNDQNRSTLLKIDPVARAIVDSLLRVSSSNGPKITWLATDEAFNPGMGGKP
jgi:hypothetical protein